MTKKLSTRLITDKSENIRCSFLHVFTPRLNDLNGKMQYSAQLLIPKKAKNTITAIKQASTNALKNKFGEKVPKSARKTPLRDGDELTDEGEERPPEYAGHWFMNVSNERPVGVVDEQVTPMLDSGEFVSGDYVRASLNAFGYQQKGNSGVSCGLMNIQRVRKGDPLGGSTRPEDDFDELEEAEAEEQSDFFDED